MSYPILQSEAVDGPPPDLTETKESSSVQQENVQFEETPTTEVDDFSGQFDQSFDDNADQTASLGKYLERPVKIHSFTWNESDQFSSTPTTFDPWALFFNNSFIKNKLQNYSRLRCKLHLTFRFNASPFYYGSLRAYYDPLKSGRFASRNVMDLIPISQTPGVYIEPQQGTMAEMVLPFLYPFDWLNTAVLSQLSNMGSISFQPYAFLRSANGVTGTGITISTYAQAVDVELAGPTVQTVLQSGMISGPASAIAVAASLYEKHVKIGPYAKAVRVGATLVSSIARMFGYSNDPVMDDVRPVQNKVFHAFANTETRVPIDKLALDPENQVTLDNRVAGTDPDDELEISRIVQHESYVASRDWVDTDAAGAAIAYGTVSPYIDETFVYGDTTYHHHTPMGWISKMFRFWRGGIRYRFRVVRSKYQKGRIMITWDPNGSYSTTGNETALFTKIFDLESPEQDFVFEIPYKAASPWLQCERASSPISSNPTDHIPAHSNGVWQVSVVNKLTGPAASNRVSLLLYVSAMADMEFSAPRALPYMNALPVQSQVIDGAPVQEVKHLADFTVGERVKSLRVLLHRTTLATKQALGQYANRVVRGGERIHAMNCYHNIPPEPGFTTGGFNRGYGGVVPATQKICNYGKMHPINWILAAFVGYRGSVNVHAVLDTNGLVEDLNQMSISRINHSPILSEFAQRNSDWWATLVDEAVEAIPYSTRVENLKEGVPTIPSGAGGMTVTHGRTQMALSANIPQYCPGRFWPAWCTKRNVFPSMTVYDGFRVDADFTIPEGTAEDTPVAGPLVSLYWSAGVDFNTVFFVGVPRLEEYDIEPYAP
jgi:hypothetical protein